MEFKEKNVLGEQLQPCCARLETGFYRTGYCETGREDLGSHTVCAEVTEVFLKFSLDRGNDLVTPRPEFAFPGLVPGDRWCLCASRWKEAFDAGVAPPIVLSACHEKSLEIVDLKELRKHALDEQ